MKKALAGATGVLLALSTITIAAPAVNAAAPSKAPTSGWSSGGNGNSHKSADRQCGGGGHVDRKEHKVTVCHKPWQNGGFEINVAKASVPAHLKNGDYVGRCGANFEVKKKTILLGATSQLMGPFDHQSNPMKPASEGGSLTRTVNGSETHVGELVGGLSTILQAVSERIGASSVDTLVPFTEYPTRSELYTYAIANENTFSMNVDDVNISDHGRYYHDVDRIYLDVFYKEFKWSHERMLTDYPTMTERSDYFHGLTPYPVQVLNTGEHVWTQDIDRFKLTCAREGEAVSMTNVMDVGLSDKPMDGDWNDDMYSYTYACSDQDDEQERLRDAVVCDINGDYEKMILQDGKRAASITKFSQSGVAAEPNGQFSAIADGEPRMFSHELPRFDVGQGSYQGQAIESIPGGNVTYERQFVMDPDSSPLLLSGAGKANVNDPKQPYAVFIREPSPTQSWKPQLDDGSNINASFGTWSPITKSQLREQREVWLKAFTASSTERSMMVTPLTKATVSIPITTEYLTGISLGASGSADYEFESGDIVMRESHICPSETVNIGWTRIS